MVNAKQVRCPLFFDVVVIKENEMVELCYARIYKPG